MVIMDTMDVSPTCWAHEIFWEQIQTSEILWPPPLVPFIVVAIIKDILSIHVSLALETSLCYRIVFLGSKFRASGAKDTFGLWESRPEAPIFGFAGAKAPEFDQINV